MAAESRLNRVQEEIGIAQKELSQVRDQLGKASGLKEDQVSTLLTAGLSQSYNGSGGSTGPLPTYPTYGGATTIIKEAQTQDATAQRISEVNRMKGDEYGRLQSREAALQSRIDNLQKEERDEIANQSMNEVYKALHGEAKEKPFISAQQKLDEIRDKLLPGQESKLRSEIQAAAENAAKSSIDNIKSKLESSTYKNKNLDGIIKAEVKNYGDDEIFETKLRANQQEVRNAISNLATEYKKLAETMKEKEEWEDKCVNKAAREKAERELLADVEGNITQLEANAKTRYLEMVSRGRINNSNNLKEVQERIGGTNWAEMQVVEGYVDEMHNKYKEMKTSMEELVKIKNTKELLRKMASNADIPVEMVKLLEARVDQIRNERNKKYIQAAFRIAGGLTMTVGSGLFISSFGATGSLDIISGLLGARRGLGAMAVLGGGGVMLGAPQIVRGISALREEQNSRRTDNVNLQQEILSVAADSLGGGYFTAEESQRLLGTENRRARIQSLTNSLQTRVNAARGTSLARYSV